MRRKSSVWVSVSVLTIAAGVLVVRPADAAARITTEAQLQAALDSGVRTIRLAPFAVIPVTTGLVHTGTNSVTIVGSNATLEARNAPGDCLVFTGGGSVTISNLTLLHGPARGLVMDVPSTKTGVVALRLKRVVVNEFDGIGVHLDDSAGSAATMLLDLNTVSFFSNGVSTSGGGVPDSDACRVEESGPGDIRAKLFRVSGEANKHDVVELRESGDGLVSCNAVRCSFVRNGNLSDGGDGLHIAESGPGSVTGRISAIAGRDNFDDGIDISEADDGDCVIGMSNVDIFTSRDDGIVVTEAGVGTLRLTCAKLYSRQNLGSGLVVDESGDGDLAFKCSVGIFSKNRGDGASFTQSDAGVGRAELRRVTTSQNAGMNVNATGVTVIRK